MSRKEERPVSAIRVKPDILHQARVAAVTQRKTLGQWLEEAILEKLAQATLVPFKFDDGQRLRILLEGPYVGRIGTVVRCFRLVELVMPPPAPKNYYDLVFEGETKEHGFSEGVLELADSF